MLHVLALAIVSALSVSLFYLHPFDWPLQVVCCNAAAHYYIGGATQTCSHSLQGDCLISLFHVHILLQMWMSTDLEPK